MSKRRRDKAPPPSAGPESTRPGSLTAHFIREAYIRYRGRPRKLEEPITTPRQAIDFARRVVQDHAREHALAVYLDSGARALAYAIVSVGTADSADIHPREVFQPAVLAGATGVILLHNHPSGDPEPSLGDYLVTDRMIEAGDLLRIYVHDSIIWTHHSRDYVSLREVKPKAFTRPTARAPDRDLGL